MHDLKYRLQLFSASTIGNIFRNRAEAYWYIKERNAGDLITPMLLKRYGFTPVHSYPNEAQIFACGSLLEKVPEGFSGVILGTGFMHEETSRSFDKAKILAVRGELTRKNTGAPADTILGDPGLLVAQFYAAKKKKRYALGILPHYVDKGDVRIRNLCKRYSKDVLFIDVQKEPLSVLEKVDMCECLLSSSLHGLVFADSLGIPNIWMVLTGQVSGKGFKFHDYHSALGKVQSPVEISGEEKLSDLIAAASLASVSRVAETKRNLDRAFRRLRTELQSVQ